MSPAARAGAEIVSTSPISRQQESKLVGRPQLRCSLQVSLPVRLQQRLQLRQSSPLHPGRRRPLLWMPGLIGIRCNRRPSMRCRWRPPSTFRFRSRVRCRSRLPNLPKFSLRRQFRRPLGLVAYAVTARHVLRVKRKCGDTKRHPGRVAIGHGRSSIRNKPKARSAGNGFSTTGLRLRRERSSQFVPVRSAVVCHHAG